MPKVTDNQLKGNYGAAVVMARLSAAECLVRPGAADTDVGVDLYCETVVPGESSVDQQEPLLHFFVQVKAGKQCKENPADKTASCSFDCSHLKYWKRQPVPVFAALVPTEWPPSTDPDVYVVDFTKRFIMDDLSIGNQGSLTLQSDYRWPAGDREVVSKFLAQDVPESTARLQCKRGVVAPLPTLTPQYEHSIPSVPVARFKKEILTQLRTTAAFSILSVLGSGKDAARDSESRRRLARIVEQFADEKAPHWEVFMALAQSSHVDQKYSSAMKSYRRAIKIIQKDLDVCNKPTWEKRIQHIERLKKRARDHQLPY